MHKARPYMGITLHGMQHGIHDRIADVSTCRVRQLAGIALCLYPAHHGLDRQLGRRCSPSTSCTSGSSTGCAPSLSGIRASARLMATRSTRKPAAPPAWPTFRQDQAGKVRFRHTTSAVPRVKLVGISRLMICAPAISSGSILTAS